MPEKPQIFISHAHENKPLVRRLERELKATGAEVWVDHSGVRLGENLPESLSQALATCNLFLLIWSNAASASHWVKLEWTSALSLQKTIIPCCLDETALPALLANLLYVDFRNEELGISKLRRDIELAQQSTSVAPSESAGELVRMLRRKWAAALPPIWNVPHHRNPNFTGREKLLQNLRAALASEQSAALIQAIHGLGGVGKTQLAVEYAYRFSHEYEVVWCLAAESPATLAADYAALAQPLALPEKEAADQNLAIAAVRRWFNHHDGWLLVFDNASEVEALHGYLPQATTGHVLITSRNPNWRSLAQSFAVSIFAPEEAIDFLCKRTGQADRDAAARLAEALGYLPLALTQAAAYIEETGKSVADYLALYQQHRQKLLSRAKPAADYPYTVATTWELSFQAVQQQCAAATDLLHLCAFLAPEEIPWDLLQPTLSEVEQLKASALADPLESDEAVAVLRRYSLLEVKDQALLLHRLVQQVTQDRLPETERTHWQEMVVRLVTEAFPIESFDVRTWPICRRLLTHALLLCEAEIVPNRLAFLCNLVGLYLHGRANYTEAEPLYRRSLKTFEKQFGSEHPHVATSLNNLAGLLESQGKYAEAEPLYRRSLEISEKQLGPEHPDVASSLNNLAGLLKSQGKSAEAEPLYRRSLEIREKQLGPQHPATGISYGNLAGVLKAQGKYDDAEPLWRKAVGIHENQLESEHPHVATGLNNLAELLRSQGKLAEAEPLYRRSLEIREQRLGPEHPDVANSLNNLAELLWSQGAFAEAEPLYRRSLEISEKRLGSEHPYVAISLNNLAVSLVSQGKYAEAEPLYRHSLEISEKQLGLEHPNVTASLNNLAGLLKSQGKYVEAEPLYRRSLAICEKTLGPEHPNTQLVRKNLTLLLEEMQGK